LILVSDCGGYERQIAHFCDITPGDAPPFDGRKAVNHSLKVLFLFLRKSPVLAGAWRGG
jgi:hypothetical protein